MSRSDPKLFIVSPARTGGERANLLYHPRAQFDLARRLRTGQGVALGEVFSFLSGLYFRGKVTYATRFARPPKGFPGVLVITSNRGLLPVETMVTLAELQAFSEVAIDLNEHRYVQPLQNHTESLAAAHARCRFVFLGSISTPKYGDVLLKSFGPRLLFPPAFVGRGDMSRGGLLLRCAAAGTELEYLPLAGAVRRGQRPPKLSPRRWGFQVMSGRTEI